MNKLSLVVLIAVFALASAVNKNSSPAKCPDLGNCNIDHSTLGAGCNNWCARDCVCSYIPDDNCCATDGAWNQQCVNDLQYLLNYTAVAPVIDGSIGLLEYWGAALIERNVSTTPAGWAFDSAFVYDGAYAYLAFEYSAERSSVALPVSSTFSFVNAYLYSGSHVTRKTGSFASYGDGDDFIWEVNPSNGGDYQAAVDGTSGIYATTISAHPSSVTTTGTVTLITYNNVGAETWIAIDSTNGIFEMKTNAAALNLNKYVDYVCGGQVFGYDFEFDLVPLVNLASYASSGLCRLPFIGNCLSNSTCTPYYSHTPISTGRITTGRAPVTSAAIISTGAYVAPITSAAVAAVPNNGTSKHHFSY